MTRDQWVPGPVNKSLWAVSSELVGVGIVDEALACMVVNCAPVE